MRNSPSPAPTRRGLSRIGRPVAIVAFVALFVGCGGQAPAAGGTPSAIAPSSPSAAPVSPLASGPDPDAGAAVDAFRAFVQTEQSFHLAGDMLMTVSNLTLQAAITSDVSKGDEQGTIDVRGPGVSIRLSLVLVDGTVYLRIANRAWQTVPTRAGFSNPLAGLHVEGLAPVDIVKVNGVRAHHLRAENPEGINAKTLSGNTLTDLTISSSSMDVYITDDGVPLTAILEFAGNAAFGGETGRVTARIRYDFSKFGQDIRIVAPVVPSPSASSSP
jgi:hypothetical protein